MTKVAILMGGRSAEREVSLRSGEQAYKGLREKGYAAVKIDAGPDLVDRLRDEKPDVVFIALHGRLGEDGRVQALLDLMDIPYTGSGVLASALGLSKAASKRIFLAEGIPTPEFVVVRRNDWLAKPEEIARNVLERVGLPVVVKPDNEGSTIGLSIVTRETKLALALDDAFRFDDEAVAERFIEGVEVTVGILGNEPEALPTLEVVTKTGFYDYETKYTPGLSEHIIPARIPEEQRLSAQELALRAHCALGCRGFSRVDLIVDRSGHPYVLEVNTIPGMTDVSLFPDAALAAGVDFPELVSRLVEEAMADRKR